MNPRLAILFALLLCFGCKREERGFRVNPPAANTIDVLRQTEFQPGPTTNEIMALLQTNSASTSVTSTN